MEGEAVSAAKNQLRFAILARVSTKRQEDEGESLDKQKRDLRKAVERFGGAVARDYSGQESATSGKARPRFEQLMQDAQRGLFDAVIVRDGSRWARNNKVNRAAIDTLREHEVRFFDIGREYDLHNRDDTLQLGLSGEMNEAYVEKMADWSLASRIERAKRGWPMGGKLPWGRRVANWSDEKRDRAEWEVVPKDKRLAERMFALYVERGLPFDEVGDKVGFPGETVRRKLRACGDSYMQRFRRKDRKPVDVPTAIPALLTPAQLAQVRTKAKVNQVGRSGGNFRFAYPLAHLVRCQHCGGVLSGQGRTNADGTETRYLRHFKAKGEVLDPRCTPYVRAAELEREVFASISAVFKQTEKLGLAVRAALATEPDKAEDLRYEDGQLEAEARRLEREQGNVVRAIKAGKPGSLTARLEADYTSTDARLRDIATRRKQIVAELAAHDVPPDAVKRVQAALGFLGRYSAMRWPPRAQTALARVFFGASVKGTKDRGIYVRMKRDRELGLHWTFDARGIIGEIAGAMGDAGTVLELHDRKGRPIDRADIRRGLSRVEVAELAGALDKAAPALRWRRQLLKVSRATYTRTC